MSISKRLEEARKGYAKGDVKLSAAAHDPKQITSAAAEKHGSASSQYLGDMVYGGLDGIITTFAVVSGVAGVDRYLPAGPLRLVIRGHVVEALRRDLQRALAAFERANRHDAERLAGLVGERLNPENRFLS